MEGIAVAIEIFGGWAVERMAPWMTEAYSVSVSVVGVLEFGLHILLIYLGYGGWEDKEAAVRKAESVSLRVNLAMVLKILASSFKIPIWYVTFCSKLCSGQVDTSETRKHISEQNINVSHCLCLHFNSS